MKKKSSDSDISSEFSSIQLWFTMSCYYYGEKGLLFLSNHVCVLGAAWLLCLHILYPQSMRFSKFTAFGGCKGEEGSDLVIEPQDKSDFRPFLWAYLSAKHAYLHNDLCKTKQRRWHEGHFLSSANELIIPQSLVVWITMKSGKFTSNPEGQNKSLK